MSHSVGQPLQFETCCTFYRSLSQKRFPKNKAVGKGKPEKAGQCWKSIDIQSLVSTCRTHEVNPYTRLVDVMQRIDPSRPRCGAADATTVEGELCRQPVGVRHRKGHPGTRAQIPQPGRQILTPTQGNVPKWPVTLYEQQRVRADALQARVKELTWAETSARSHAGMLKWNLDRARGQLAAADKEVKEVRDESRDRKHTPELAPR